MRRGITVKPVGRIGNVQLFDNAGLAKLVEIAINRRQTQAGMLTLERSVNGLSCRVLVGTPQHIDYKLALFRIIHVITFSDTAVNANLQMASAGGRLGQILSFACTKSEADTRQPPAKAAQGIKSVVKLTAFALNGRISSGIRRLSARRAAKLRHSLLTLGLDGIVVFAHIALVIGDIIGIAGLVRALDVFVRFVPRAVVLVADDA